VAQLEPKGSHQQTSGVVDFVSRAIFTWLMVLIKRILEVCYNLRHFEKHGRELQDPWSCRQSVVHHRHCLTDGLSSWIVVQPSMRWQAALDDVRMSGIVHPLSLHLRSISSAIAENWEYLEYLSTQISLLVGGL
jgi:hypothetical protein